MIREPATNFYPRSPCGERRATKSDQGASNQFLSTLSLRRATTNGCTTVPNFRNFYPRSPCGERRRRSVKLFRQNYISIHALLAESDLSLSISALWMAHFYPRSPCGERPVVGIGDLYPPGFLSTLSLRRATRVGIFGNKPYHISIHALLAESDANNRPEQQEQHDFYPRSPCGERPPVREIIQWEGIFLSTLSLRRATRTCQYFFSNF